MQLTWTRHTNTMIAMDTLFFQFLRMVLDHTMWEEAFQVHLSKIDPWPFSPAQLGYSTGFQIRWLYDYAIYFCSLFTICYWLLWEALDIQETVLIFICILIEKFQLGGTTGSTCMWMWCSKAYNYCYDTKVKNKGVLWHQLLQHTGPTASFKCDIDSWELET